MQKQNMNQDKKKEGSRTPRFILVYSFSRVTSSLFANKQKNFTKEHNSSINTTRTQFCTLQECYAESYYTTASISEHETNHCIYKLMNNT